MEDSDSNILFACNDHQLTKPLDNRIIEIGPERLPRQNDDFRRVFDRRKNKRAAEGYLLREKKILKKHNQTN